MSYYYTLIDILSHNCLLNFILSNRGSGKTYSCKRWAILDFLKTGSEFVYVRRYDSELRKCELFFEDIKHEFPDHEFKVESRTFYIDDTPCGYAIPLSTSLKEKSTPYPKVNKIIFDEFIVDKGFIRYISNEVEIFLELFSTIARTRDNVRAFFLANSISTVNPYFDYFNIELNDSTPRFSKYQNNLIIVERYTNDQFIEKMNSTRYGRLVSSTQYGNYAILNKFFKDDNAFIRPKGSGDKIIGEFIYNNYNFLLYYNSKENYLIVTDILKPKSTHTKFVIYETDYKEGYIHLRKNPNEQLKKLLKYHYNNSTLFFINQSCKVNFMEILTRII